MEQLAKYIHALCDPPKGVITGKFSKDLLSLLAEAEEERKKDVDFWGLKVAQKNLKIEEILRSVAMLADSENRIKAELTALRQQVIDIRQWVEDALTDLGKSEYDWKDYRYIIDKNDFENGMEALRKLVEE